MLPNPPIGTGGYAGWFFFVFVLVLSLTAAIAILGVFGIRAKS